METIAIVNQKGGSGKTTLTVNLAQGLQRRGKRVVVIDLDPQGGASAWCGFNQELTGEDYGQRLLEALTEGKPLLGELFQATGKGFFIVPNSTEFVAFDVAARSKMAHEQLLRKAIAQLPGAELDYVLLDTPPNISPVLTNALTAADGFLLAIEAQAPNIDPADRAYRLTRQVAEVLNPKLKCAGIVLGKVDARRLQDRDMFALLQETYGEDVYKQWIRYSTRFGEAFSFEKTIQEHDGRGIGARDFMALTDQFIERREGKPTRKGRAHG